MSGVTGISRDFDLFCFKLKFLCAIVKNIFLKIIIKVLFVCIFKTKKYFKKLLLLLPPTPSRILPSIFYFNKKLSTDNFHFKFSWQTSHTHPHEHMHVNGSTCHLKFQGY